MHVTAINIAQRLAITDTGIACGVSVWIDSDGDETDGPETAVCAVVHLPDGMWETVDLREFDAAPMQ